MTNSTLNVRFIGSSAISNIGISFVNDICSCYKIFEVRVGIGISIRNTSMADKLFTLLFNTLNYLFLMFLNRDVHDKACAPFIRKNEGCKCLQATVLYPNRETVQSAIESHIA